MSRHPVYDKNLYGEFAEALQDHLREYYPDISLVDIGQAISGLGILDSPGNPDEATMASKIARWGRQYARGGRQHTQEWYYDAVIGQILQSFGKMLDPEAGAATMVDTQAMGYLIRQFAKLLNELTSDELTDSDVQRLVGEHVTSKQRRYNGPRDRLELVEALRLAILAVAFGEGGIAFYLDAVPLEPQSPFCLRMYREYDRRYQQDSGRAVSDLQREVEGISRDDLDWVEGIAFTMGYYSDNERLYESVAIFERVLSMSLMGPAAMRATSSVGATPRIEGRGTDAPVTSPVLAGCSLTLQELQPDRSIAAGQAARFMFPDDGEPAGDVLMGREAAQGVDFATGGSHPYVSRRHAAVHLEYDGDGEARWSVMHLSGTNATAVCHSDGDVALLTSEGQREPLLSGDEIWLVPGVAPDGSIQPLYQDGAVITFRTVQDYR